MSDLKKYNPPPGSSDLYLAASKHFQQAKLILENVLSPDPEVRKLSQIISCCSILRRFFFPDKYLFVVVIDLINEQSQVNRILKVAKPNIVVTKLLAGGHKKDIKVAVFRQYYMSLNSVTYTRIPCAEVIPMDRGVSHVPRGPFIH